MIRAGAEKETAEWRRRWASHRKQEGPDYHTVWPLTFLICKIGTESQEVYRGRNQQVEVRLLIRVRMRAWTLTSHLLSPTV